MNRSFYRLALVATLAFVAGCGDKSPKVNSSTTAPVIGQILPTRGPTAGGTVAVIKGNNFRPGTTVSFGDAAAAFVKVVDTTTLTVVTPEVSLAGKVNIVISSADGQSTTFTDGFQYYVNDGSVSPPGLSSINPNTGPASGGTVALVTGEHFTDGILLFVGRSPASDVVVADPQTLSGTLPAGDVGSADVEVTNPDGQSTKLTGAFAYSDADGVPPVLSAISPVAGSTQGGTEVALAGTNFRAGALIFFGGRTATAVTVMGNSASGTTPAGAPGVVDVAITNPDGRSAVLRRGYNYYVGGPVISRMTPNFGPPDGGTDVLIEGRNFSERTLVTIGGSVLQAARRVDDRAITGTTPAGPVGAADVRVENDDGQSDTLVNGWAWGSSAPPTFSIARVSPEIGPISGMTRVTVIGSGFESGATVTFGGQPATGVQVVGGATISCTTPSGTIGPVEVVVTQGTRQAKLPLGFWYFDPALRGSTPSIAAVTPALGPQTGGTMVLITGSGYATGARVYFGTQEATQVTVVSASTLTAVTPAGTAPGPVDVRVQNADGQVVTQNQGFVYVDPRVLGPAPIISSVNPNNGGSAETTAVVLTTQNVSPGALLFAGGVPAQNVTLSTGMVNANFLPHSAGAVDVVITNPDGQTGRLPNGFTYNRSPPRLTAVTPNTVPLGGGLKVLLSGTGFEAGATVTVDGVASPTTFVDDTLVFITAPPHAAGTVDVVITNTDQQSSTLTGGLTYANITLGNAPTVTSITPARGPTTGGTVALVIGTNFAQGIRVLFGSTPATGVTVMNDTRLSVIAPAGTAGVVDLTVVNADGQSAQLLRGFTYVDPSQLGTAPRLASVTPNSGLATGGTQTVLTGMGFQPGMLVFFGGYSASAAATQNTGIATATSPAGPSGRVDVAITNPDGQSSTLVNGFSYTPRPVLTTIFPATGPTTGGTAFTIAGSNFSPGARVYFGTTEASMVMVGSATVITGNTPPHPLGTVDVRVLNVDGQDGILTGGFAYNPPPSLLTVKPGGGPLAGGTTLLINGTGFQAGATVRVGGVAATQVRVVNGTVLYAVTPAGTAGAATVEVTNPDTQVANLPNAFRYDAVDSLARRATSYPDVIVPMARDDAAYKSDLAIANLSGRPLTVTVTGYDNTGTSTGGRALAAAIPPNGRVVVTDVLRFVAAATTQQNVTGSVVVTADGPIAANVLMTDRSSSDGFVIPGSTQARSAGRLLVPYASNVGAFRTWLTVRNVGTTAATVDITARAADGSQAGRISSLTIAPNATYTNDDVLGTMNVSNSNVTFEVNGGTTAQLLASARVYSNGRLGGVLQGRPYTDASSTQVLGYVPDTTNESSVLYLTNTDSTGAASATLELFTSQGQSLGTRTVNVPANGFTSVPDLARTLLSRTTPTQTVSMVKVSSARALMTAGFVLTTSNSDLRLYNGHTGAGMRFVVPVGEPRTGLTIANVGLGPASVEIALRVDSGAGRGNALTVSIPPNGLFNAPLVLSSLGAGTASGVVEVRSLSGTPVLATARVGNDPGGALGDCLDLGTITTTPSLDGLLPNSGPATGGTMARATGAYLLPQAQFLFGAVPATRGFVSDDTTAVVVSPPGTLGQNVSLTAINFDGTAATLPNAFGYMDPALLGVGPSIASVSPGQISILGGTPMQVNGANFQSQAQAFVGLSPITGATLVNPGRIDGAAPTGPIGLADVTVTNPDGQSVTLTNAVRYVVPPPTITSVTPNTGPGQGGTTVRINGSGFQVGASVGFGGTSAPSAVVLTPTDIDVVSPIGADGPVAITIINPDGQSVTQNNGFTYVAPPNPVQVTPSSGPTTGGTNITITGTFFRAGATVKVGLNDCTSVNVQMGGTALTCTTPTGSSGPVAIRVTNPDNQTGVLNNAFTYLAPVPPPTVTGVSPAFGPVTGGTQVTVLGTNFQAGATVRFGTIQAPAANVISPSAIVVTIPGQGGPGVVSITVTNPDSQAATLAGGFSYFQPADLPAITVVSLTPNQGPTVGGTVVFISGRGFKAGATVRFDTSNATNVVYLGPSALQATTPAHAAGNVNVTVVNPDATSSTLANGFNYNNGVIFRFPPSRLPLTQERGYNLARFFDVDNDGDQDAYMARVNVNYDSDGIDRLWVNDGTGTFILDPTFPGDARTDTQDVIIADFDGNGTKDMFVLSPEAASWTGTTSRLIRQTQVGTYVVTNPPMLPQGCCSGIPQRSATPGDLNQDGFLDLYLSVSGLDYMYLNQRDGGFAPTRTGLPAVNDDSVASCVGDYDRDGDDDVFVVNSSNQQANYYLQTQDAGYFALSNALIPVVGGAGSGCVTAEFRPGSGIKDIVVVKSGQIYQYLKNDGTGRFADEAATLNIHRLPNMPPSLNIARKPEAIDIDSDGDLDLVMRHTDTNPRYQVYVNDGAGFFVLGTATRMPPLLDADTEGAFGDVNSDGRPDLLIPGYGTQSRLLLNSPTGLSYATMKNIPEQSYCAAGSAHTDIDGDGDQDIIIAHGCKRGAGGCSGEPATCRGDKIRIWVNDGAGGFTDATSTRFPAMTYNATTVEVADLDVDGDPDLVVGSFTAPQSLYLYFNNGSGVFTDGTYPRLPPTSPAMTSSILIFDINKDGAPDIMESDVNGQCGCQAQNVKLFLNTGNGFFFNVSNQLPLTGFGCSEYPYTLATGDFDRDTYPDIHIGMNGRARLWLNRGAINPGFFIDVTNSNVPNVSDTTVRNLVADLNNDTFPDIFACNSATDRINLGNNAAVLSDVTATNWPGESQPYPYQVMIGGNNGPVPSESCTVGDVDVDGDQDLVIAGGGGNGFNFRDRLYVNSGSATFSDQTVQSMPFDTAYTMDIFLFNANADARPDLFVGNCGQPYILLNGP